MSAGSQIAFTKSWLERQGIEAQLIDVEAYIDPSLSYEENIKLMKREFKLGGGRSRQPAARGLTAAECDVAIGNYEAGYNGEEMRKACLCGQPDACVDLERAGRAAKAKKAKPTTVKQEVTLKTIGGRYHLCSGKSKPVEILQEDAYKFVCDKVHKDFAGKRVSNKKLREYAEKHGFYPGWVESAYDKIKPSRSIDSIERDIKKVDEKSYKRVKASHAFGGNLPGGGALDRDMQRIWEGKRTLKAELERAKQQATAAPKRKPAKKADKEPWEMRRDEYVDRHIRSPAMHWESVRLALSKGYKVPARVLKDYPDLVAAAKTTRPAKPAVPDVLETPTKRMRDELDAALAGGFTAKPMRARITREEHELEKTLREWGKGVHTVPPALAPAAPKRKTAAKAATKPPAKSKPKKAAAKTTKPKAKKPAPAGTVLTAAQKKRLAAKGSITIKRGGKFVTVTR